MEILQITDQMIEDAKELIANGQAKPVGYRILVKSLEIDTGMASGLKELAPTLAGLDFQDKSEEEAKRQTKGTYFGIVVAIGEQAYSSEHLGVEPWVEVGDVSISERYAGVTIELPPGSGNNFQIMNDENIIGVMTPKED